MKTQVLKKLREKVEWKVSAVEKTVISIGIGITILYLMVTHDKGSSVNRRCPSRRCGE